MYGPILKSSNTPFQSARLDCKGEFPRGIFFVLIVWPNHGVLCIGVMFTFVVQEISILGCHLQEYTLCASFFTCPKISFFHLLMIAAVWWCYLWCWVVLMQCTGIFGCGWPRSSRVDLNGIMLPVLGTATNLKIEHSVGTIKELRSKYISSRE